jgi:NAD(P)-dependent dehydrogenase (short-subunit alcohol dehydrogenase family)
MTRTYAITGAASGIGAAARTLLEAAGHRVIGVDLRDTDVVCDLATPEGRAHMVAEVGERCGGRLDAVIANAGIGNPEPLTVRVNYFGTLATLEGLRPYLLEGTDPRAVLTSSIASLREHVDEIVDACLDGDEEAAVEAASRVEDNVELRLIYHSTKFALNQWMKREAPTEAWAGNGIPLNGVAPGLTRTAATQALIDDPGFMNGKVDDGYGVLGSLLIDPVEIAQPLVWLASPENTRITGQMLWVDGGTHLKMQSRVES